MVPDGHCIIVRADGAKASKRHLKGVLFNRKFPEALGKAIIACSVLWKDRSPRGSQPYLLGALQFGAEVSFVVGTGPNYFDRRIMKITTTPASTLSADATANFGAKTPCGHPEIIAFDGRPLVLANRESVLDYAERRWLCAIRLAVNKILRIQGVLDERVQYRADLLFDSLERLTISLNQAGLADQLPQACSDFQMCVENRGAPRHRTRLDCTTANRHAFIAPCTVLAHGPQLYREAVRVLARLSLARAVCTPELLPCWNSTPPSGDPWRAVAERP